MTTQTLVVGSEMDRGEEANYSFLAEKERRSDSAHTIHANSRMPFHLYGSLSRTSGLVSSQEVFAYAHSNSGRPGGLPQSPVTVGARAACLSSFYKSHPNEIAEPQPLRPAGAPQAHTGAAQRSGRPGHLGESHT